MYDLILKNGRVIDPSQGLDAVTDIAMQDGKVAAIGTAVGAGAGARDVRDVRGMIVTPGLIDLHTHVYWGGTSIGVDPTTVARQSGCTTLVDAGTAGAGNLLGLRKHVIEPALPRVLAFINISFAGIFAFSQEVMVGECGDQRLLNSRACRRVAEEHADIVVGVKVRVGQIAGGNSGLGPLEVALDVAGELGLPVMTHLDYPPPGRKDVLDRLRSGDVLTHCFRPFPNAPVQPSGRIHDEVMAARERGVIFDIGHGMGSFGFGTARRMLAGGFYPDVISSDVHSLCINGPAYDVLVTMSKLLCLGMPLNEVIRGVTSTPACVVGRPDLGALTAGAIGDATVLELRTGDFEYQDVLGETISGSQRFFLKQLIKDGHVVEL